MSFTSHSEANYIDVVEKSKSQERSSMIVETSLCYVKPISVMKPETRKGIY